MAAVSTDLQLTTVLHCIMYMYVYIATCIVLYQAARKISKNKALFKQQREAENSRRLTQRASHERRLQVMQVVGHGSALFRTLGKSFTYSCL